MAATRPGVFEYEIEAAVEHEFRRRGGDGPAYGTIVASGANATILHYTQNDRRMEAGDLLLLDAGCELSCYASDVTRTWPVSGRFTPVQKRVYELVLEAQRRSIAQVGPGKAFDAAHTETVRTLVAGLIDLKLLSGSVDENIEKKTFRRFYMHRTGHWLGLDVHDAGAYFTTGTNHRTLEPDMVVTVEPGLYFAEDDAQIPAEYRGIGVRIEDDVLVTTGGSEVLTAACPKSVVDVEKTVGVAVPR
jgi:Xaa-Pro aminopeptidase